MSKYDLFVTLVTNAPPDLSLVKALLRSGWDPTSTEPDGFTIFHRRELYYPQQRSLLVTLLEHTKRDLFRVNGKFLQNPMQRVCEEWTKPMTESIGLLLSHPFTTCRSETTGNLLHHLCDQADSSIVDLLVQQHNQNLEEKNITGATPLHSALSRRGSTSLTAALLRYPIKIDHRAIELSLESRPHFLLLLEKGANVNSRSPSTGKSLLHMLVESSNLDCDLITILLDAGVDVDQTDKDGATALYSLFTTQRPSLLMLPLRIQVASLLLCNGANLHARCNKSDEAVHARAVTWMIDILLQSCTNFTTYGTLEKLFSIALILFSLLLAHGVSWPEITSVSRFAMFEAMCQACESDPELMLYLPLIARKQLMVKID